MSLETARAKTLTALSKYQKEVEDEIMRATDAYGPINSPHEGYGILQEEVDEFFDEVRCNNNKKARQEMLQVAAVAIRYLIDSEHWR